MMNNNVKRCKQCGKILVGDTKAMICPKCLDNDKRDTVGVLTAVVLIGLTVKKYGKTGVELVKSISKLMK